MQKTTIMKKITIAFLFFMSCYMQAQISFEAAKNFGKLEDITYDSAIQNKMYAATQGNHIVVSNDNGSSWNLKYSFPNPVARITDLKNIKGTSLSFSLVNAESENGIYLLDIATNTITGFYQVPNSSENPEIVSYDFYDSLGTNLIVHASYSEGTKVFHTTNSGTSWNLVYYSGDNNDVHVNNVAISPANGSKLFIARSLGSNNVNGGLLISTDAGTTWTESMPGYTFDSITFNPTNANDILIGTSISFGLHDERLYRTLDGGTTWTIIPIDWTDMTLNNITGIAVHPQNPNHILVLDENEIAKSTDGGATWTNTAYPEESTTYYYGLNASYNPFDVNQVAITTDLFPQFSNDGGTTLLQLKSPFYSITSVSVAKYAAVKHLYYGSQGGRLHKILPDGNTSMYDIEPPTSFNPKKNYIFADSTVPGRVFTYASGGFYGGNLYVSNDYGATTTILMNAFADDMQELKVDPNNSNIVYASLRSGEGGSLYKFNITDLDNITYEEIITPQTSESGDGIVTGVSISTGNSNEIYIAKATKFFKSTDGGTTWVEKINGLTGIDLIWDMARNPLNENHFTVTSNIGVFTTNDAGDNWTQVLSGVDTKRIKYSPLNDGVMVVAVHSADLSDASIYYTVDSGTTWSNISSAQLSYIESYSMDFDFEGTEIDAFIATTDLGVIKYTIQNLPLSIDTPNSQANPIAIYPNPATDILHIGVNGNAFEIKSTAIYSITGQRVLESTTSEINVSGLSNGIYIVNVEAQSGETYAQKLIKK